MPRNEIKFDTDILVIKGLINQEFPWFGPAVVSLRPVLVESFRDSVPSGYAVDREGRVYIDPRNFTEYPLEFQKAAFLHELFHWLHNHFERAVRYGGFSQKVNIWADWEINSTPYIRQRFRASNAPFQTAHADDEGLPLHLLLEEYAQEKDDDDDEGGQPGKKKPGKDGDNHHGSAPGEAPRDWELPFSGEGDDPDSDGLTQEESQTIRRRVAENISKAVKDGSFRSDSGAGWKTWAEEVLAPPKIPWQEKLPQLALSAAAMSPGADDYTFSRRSRRSLPGVLLPGSYSPEIVVCYVRDVSSSMGDDAVREGDSEAQGLLETICSELRVISCSTQITDHGLISELRDLGRGCGGTDLREGIAAALTGEPEPHALIVWTDGYTPWPDEPTPVPMVVCLAGKNKCQPDRVPSWAHVLVID